MLVYRKNFTAEDYSYRRMGRVGDPCVYCGQCSNSLDHIPPLSAYSRMDMQDKDHCNPVTVPACVECNSILNAHPALTITERRSIVKNKLRKKYRKFLKMPRWDESELSEMDERMADDIRRASYFAEHIKQRLGFYRGRK